MSFLSKEQMLTGGIEKILLSVKDPNTTDIATVDTVG